MVSTSHGTESPSTLRRHDENIGEIGEGRVVGHGAGKTDLAPIAVKTKCHRVLDRPLDHRARNTFRPMGRGQKIVNEDSVEPRFIGVDLIINAIDGFAEREEVRRHDRSLDLGVKNSFPGGPERGRARLLPGRQREAAQQVRRRDIRTGAVMRGQIWPTSSVVNKVSRRVEGGWNEVPARLGYFGQLASVDLVTVSFGNSATPMFKFGDALRLHHLLGVNPHDVNRSVLLDRDRDGIGVYVRRHRIRRGTIS